MAHEDDDDLWTELYGEAAPLEEQRSAAVRPDVALPAPEKPPQAALPPPPPAETLHPQEPSEKAVGVQAADAAFSEEAATEGGAGAQGGEEEDDDDLDIQLDGPDTAQEQADSEDDEFEVMLDADEDIGEPGGSAQQAAESAHMYVRPGADTPQTQPSSSAGTATLRTGSTGAAAGGLSAEPASMVPGMMSAPTSSAIVPAPPRAPTGPPPVWPHTLQRYVPPQGLGVDEPVLPSMGKPGQRIRLPGQTRVMHDEYKEFLALGHGDIFDLDPDLVLDAPWRHPGADVSAFFNYDHSMRTWREYCKKVEQYRLQFTMQKKIQTLDASDSAIDPDLPPELRAALAAERRDQQPAPPPRRPYSAQGGGRGPRPPFRQTESNAVVLAGASTQQANGRPDDQGNSGSGPRVANGQGIKVRLSSGEVKINLKRPQENGVKGPQPPPGPKPPPGRPPPRPPSVPPPRPPSGPPPGPRPPPRPPPGAGFEGPGMMGGMGGMPMGFGPMGPMGPMGMMGGPMGMGMGGSMMGMGMPGGPMMGGPMLGGPMMGGPMGGHPPMPPMMMGMGPDAMMGNGPGWGRSRKHSLAELGITEEEFEEYAAKKPTGGDSDVGAGSLAMGMDVDPASQQPSTSNRRPNGSGFAEAGGYRGRRNGDSGSDDEHGRDRHRDRMRDSGRERHRSNRRSRSRSRDRDSKRSRHADDGRRRRS